MTWIVSFFNNNKNNYVLIRFFFHFFTPLHARDKIKYRIVVRTNAHTSFYLSRIYKTVFGMT